MFLGLGVAFRVSYVNADAADAKVSCLSKPVCDGLLCADKRISLLEL